jgi:flagellar basal-body rod modification protein FlgD
MANGLLAGVGPSVVSGINPSAPTVPTDNTTLAANFTTFLQLLTTQLQNQNPLDPLDTNQFTQQLVQFAQVEQQLKSNADLDQLVSIEQSAQGTSAMAFVGTDVVINGATTGMTNGQASWAFAVDKPATATVTITDASGQAAYTGTMAVNPGTQMFNWDGRGTDGRQWPDGQYTISVTAQDASGQSVAISTQVEGIVDSVDLTKNPPLLSMGGINFTLDKILRIVRPTTGGGGDGSGSGSGGGGSGGDGSGSGSGGDGSSAV